MPLDNHDRIVSKALIIGSSYASKLFFAYIQPINNSTIKTKTVEQVTMPSIQPL